MSMALRPTYRSRASLVCLVKGHEWGTGLLGGATRTANKVNRYPFRCKHCPTICWVDVGAGFPSGPDAPRLDNGYGNG